METSVPSKFSSDIEYSVITSDVNQIGSFIEYGKIILSVYMCSYSVEVLYVQAAKSLSKLHS